MSPSFKYAVCGVILASSFTACNAGPAKSEISPVAKIRLQLDVARSRVWLLTGQGLAIYDSAAPDKVRQIHLPGWRFAGTSRGCLPDLALGPKGEAVVSSDVLPVLWRVDPLTLEVTRHELQFDADTDKEVGFTVLRYLPARGKYLAVSRQHGTVWRIDQELRNAHRMGRQVLREQDCGARAAALMR